MEVGELEAAGLGFVADPARSSATIDARLTRYPVILLSPERDQRQFYSALAEDLASHGFVVIGLDHPFQVAAVALDADVAAYAAIRRWRRPPRSRGAIDQRVADLGFVLDRLDAGAIGLGALSGHLDLSRVVVLAIPTAAFAAAQACLDSRIDACLYIDGQLPAVLSRPPQRRRTATPRSRASNPPPTSRASPMPTS